MRAERGADVGARGGDRGALCIGRLAGPGTGEWRAGGGGSVFPRTRSVFWALISLPYSHKKKYQIYTGVYKPLLLMHLP